MKTFSVKNFFIGIHPAWEQDGSYYVVVYNDQGECQAQSKKPSLRAAKQQKKVFESWNKQLRKEELAIERTIRKHKQREEAKRNLHKKIAQMNLTCACGNSKSETANQCQKCAVKKRRKRWENLIEDFLNGMTIKEMSQKYKVSKERIKQILETLNCRSGGSLFCIMGIDVRPEKKSHNQK